MNEISTEVFDAYEQVSKVMSEGRKPLEQKFAEGQGLDIGVAIPQLLNENAELRRALRITAEALQRLELLVRGPDTRFSDD